MVFRIFYRLRGLLRAVCKGRKIVFFSERLHHFRILILEESLVIWLIWLITVTKHSSFRELVSGQKEDILIAWSLDLSLLLFLIVTIWLIWLITVTKHSSFRELVSGQIGDILIAWSFTFNFWHVTRLVVDIALLNHYTQIITKV